MAIDVSAKRAWYDVTTVMDAAAASLSGGMIHAPEFSLYEAMHAVDLTEEHEENHQEGKANVGVRRPPAPEAVTPTMVCALTDAMLARELAWLKGHTLAQTVLTCRLMCSAGTGSGGCADVVVSASTMHGNTKSGENDALAAIVASQRACVARVLDIVAIAKVAEEEDFVCNRYGFVEGDTTHCAAQLFSAIANAEATAATTTTTTAAANAAGTNDIDNKVNQALLGRLKLRWYLLDAFSRIDALPDTSTPLRATASGGDSAKDVEAQEKKKKKETAACCDDIAKTHVAQIRTALDACLSALQHVMDLGQVGTPALVSDFFFKDKRTRRLLGPSPTAKCTISDTDTAMREMHDTLSAMIRACNVTECTTLDDVRDFVLDFCTRDVGVLPRSLLWLVIRRLSPRVLRTWKVHISGTHTGRETPRDTEDTENKFIEDFEEAAYERIQLLLRAYCGNPGRRRRALRHCVASWAGLYAFAVHSERALRWVQATVLRQQIDMLQFGFALELYAEHEYMMVYWYLGHLVNLLTRVMEQQHRDEYGHSHDATRDNNSRLVVAADLALWSLKESLCQGAVRLLAALRKGGVAISTSLSSSSSSSSSSSFIYNNEVDRFKQRFGCFDAVPFPRAIAYEEYTQAVDASGRSIAELYRAAMPCFTNARVTAGMLKKLPIARHADEVAVLDRVAAANGIAAQVLLGRCGDDDVKTTHAPAMHVQLEHASSPLFFTLRCSAAKI